MEGLQFADVFDLPLLPGQILKLRIQEYDSAGALIDITGRTYTWSQFRLRDRTPVLSPPLTGTGVGFQCEIAMTGAQSEAIWQAAQDAQLGNEVYRPGTAGDAPMALGEVLVQPRTLFGDTGTPVNGPTILLDYHADTGLLALRVAGSSGLSAWEGLSQTINPDTGEPYIDAPTVQSMAEWIEGFAPALINSTGFINLGTYPEWASMVPVQHVITGSMGPPLVDGNGQPLAPTDISFLVYRAMAQAISLGSGGIHIPPPPDGYEWLCAADPNNLAATPLYINYGRIVNGVRVFDADGGAFTHGFTVSSGGSSAWLRGIVKIGAPWAISSTQNQTSDPAGPHPGEPQASLGVVLANFGVVGSLDCYCLQNSSYTIGVRVIPWYGATNSTGFNTYFCNTMDNYSLRVDLGTRFGGLGAARIESSPQMKFFAGSLSNCQYGIVFAKVMTYSQSTQSPILLGTRFEGVKGTCIDLTNTSGFKVDTCQIVPKGQWDSTIGPMTRMGSSTPDTSDVDSSVNGIYVNNTHRGDVSAQGTCVLVDASNSVNLDNNRFVLANIAIDVTANAHNVVFGLPGIDTNIYSTTIAIKRRISPLATFLDPVMTQPNGLDNSMCLVAQRVTAATVASDGSRTVGALDRWYARVVSGQNTVTSQGTIGKGGGSLLNQNLGTNGAESTVKTQGWVYTGALSLEISQRMSARRASYFAGKLISGNVLAQTNAVNDGACTAVLSLYRCVTKEVYDSTMVLVGSVSQMLVTSGNPLPFDGWDAGDCSLGMEWRLQFNAPAPPVGAIGSREFEVGLASITVDPLHRPFKPSTFVDEYAECRQYYWKSNAQADAPGTATTNGAFRAVAVAAASSAARVTVQVSFGGPMYAVPAVTVLSSATGAAGFMRDETAGADVAATADRIGDAGCIARLTGAATVQNLHACHVVAAVTGF